MHKTRYHNIKTRQGTALSVHLSHKTRYRIVCPSVSHDKVPHCLSICLTRQGTALSVHLSHMTRYHIVCPSFAQDMVLHCLSIFLTRQGTALSVHLSHNTKYHIICPSVPPMTLSFADIFDLVKGLACLPQLLIHSE